MEFKPSKYLATSCKHQNLLYIEISVDLDLHLRPLFVFIFHARLVSLSIMLLGITRLIPLLIIILGMTTGIKMLVSSK